VVACLLYQICPPARRSLFLLVASYAFYCTWSIKAAAAMAVVTILTFFAGRWTSDTESQHRAHVAAAFTVVLLTGYLAFLKAAAVTAMPLVGHMALPIGVSYYTFKLISYVMDTYSGKLQPERRFIPFAAYVAFFPQILAGPIQRPGDFLKQAPPARTEVLEGAGRIVWGLAKKMLIADQLAATVSYVFGHMQGLQGVAVLAGFYLYPLQLYADFSGLTDIAIGIGLLFGIRSPENFNRPFTASTITDFWRRWHMSLTSWLGDYVFVPLRMATRSLAKAGLVISIAVNTIAIGIWHGFTWNYFTFGAIHAVYLIAEALTSRQRARFFKKRPELDRAGTWLGRFYVFHMAAIAFVFFRAQSMADAVWGLKHLWIGAGSLGAGMARLADAVDTQRLAMGLAGFGLVLLAEQFRPDGWVKRMGSRLPFWTYRVVRAAVIMELALAMFLLVTSTGHAGQPFIYEGF